jgi:peroxiredoxin
MYLLVVDCSTFVCPTEIIAFSDRVEEFRKLNCEVVACSCDSHFSHLAWVQSPRKDGGLGDMKIPVLADFTKKIAEQYGVLDSELGLAFRSVLILLIHAKNLNLFHLQRIVLDRPERRDSSFYVQRFASWSKRRRNAASSQGIPVR